MDTMTIVMIIMGTLTLLGLSIWLKSQQAMGLMDGDNTSTQNEIPMLLTTHQGQLVHINHRAQQLFGTDDVIPSLEHLARHVHPVENFFALLNQTTESTFQIHDRWVSATANTIPTLNGQQIAITLQEIHGNNTENTQYDLSLAMTLVQQVGDLTHTSMTIEQTSNVIIETLMRHLPAVVGELCIWNAQLDALIQRGWVGDASYLIAMAERGGQYTMGEGIVGWVAQQRQPLILNQHNELAEMHPIMQKMDYHSTITIPLHTSTQLLGTLSFYHTESNSYQSEHLALLQAISHSLTTALQKAQHNIRQEERIREIASLHDIVEKPRSSDDTRLIIDLLTQRITRLLNVDLCGIFMPNDNRTAMVPEIPCYGLPDSIARLLILPLVDGSPQNDVWEVQPYWFTNKIDGDPVLESLGVVSLLKIAGIHNIALMPMILGGERIGFVAIGNKKGDYNFTPHDIQNLQILMAQVTIVVENVRLYQRENQINKELIGLREMTQSIGLINHETEFFAEISERVARLMQSEVCGILLMDDSRQRLVAQIPFYGINDDKVANYSIDIASVYDIWSSSNYWYTNQVSRDITVVSAGLEELAKDFGIHKTLMAIILVDDQQVGLIQVANKIGGRDYNDYDARLLRNFATQAAVIIKNARLQIETSKRLDEQRIINGFNLAISSTLNMDDLIDIVHEQLPLAIDTKDFDLALYDKSTQTIHFPLAVSHGARIDREPRTLNDDEVSYIIKNQHPLSLTPETSKNIIPWEENTKSYIGVPLFANGETIGALAIHDENQPMAFNEATERILTIISAQLSQTIQNIRLFEQASTEPLAIDKHDAQQKSAILESIAEGVLLMDANGHIMMLNSAAEHILKLRHTDAIGQHITDIPTTHGDASNVWVKVLTGWTSDIQNTTSNFNGFATEQIEFGELTIRINLSPVYINKQFMGTVAVFHDTTRDTEISHIKNQFITNVSHEFRTPLTPIKGYTSLLLMGKVGNLNEQQISILNIINKNVERLSALVNAVLNIAQIDAQNKQLTIQPVNLGEILLTEFHKVAAYPSSIEKNLTTAVSIDDNLPQIYADQEKLTHVVYNLIENAFNYTRPNDSITANLSLQTDGQHVLLTIADTGIGIPEHFQHAVWRRFERYDDHALELNVTGTGLGLSLVKDLVTLHHGDVWFESELDQGTIFYVKLPITHPSPSITQALDHSQIDMGD